MSIKLTGGGSNAPDPHAPTHEDGGSDEVTIQNLDSTGAAAGTVLTADGSGGLSFAAAGGGALEFMDVVDVASGFGKSLVEFGSTGDGRDQTSLDGDVDMFYRVVGRMHANDDPNGFSARLQINGAFKTSIGTTSWDFFGRASVSFDVDLFLQAHRRFGNDNRSLTWNGFASAPDGTEFADINRTSITEAGKITSLGFRLWAIDGSTEVIIDGCQLFLFRLKEPA